MILETEIQRKHIFTCFFYMKEIEVQLSPFGEYPQTRDDGTT